MTIKSGQESLRRNGVAIIVNKTVQSILLECSLKNDRMICLFPRQFFITVIQVYASTTDSEEAEFEWFNEELGNLLEHQQNIFFI